MYFSGSEIACRHGYFLFTEKHGLSGRKYIHLPYLKTLFEQKQKFDNFDPFCLDDPLKGVD